MSSSTYVVMGRPTSSTNTKLNSRTTSFGQN